MSATTAISNDSSGEGGDRDGKQGTNNASSLEIGDNNKKSSTCKKVPDPRHMLSEQTLIFLQHHSDYVSLLSQRDYGLFIGILEGNMEDPSDFDFLFSLFENDGMFVLFSLLVGVNNQFFSNNTSDRVFSDPPVEVLPHLQTRQALQQEFHKIKNRWKLLDKISEATYKQSAGSDVSVNMMMNVVVVKLRERLFERLMNVGKNFTGKPDRLATVSNDGSPEALGVFDASFCLPLIDKNSFAVISSLVEENLISVFNSAARYDPNCRDYYLQYYMTEYDVCDIPTPQPVEANDASNGATPFGVLWESSRINSEVRKVAEMKLFLNVMNILRTNGGNGEAKSKLTINQRTRSFFSVIKKLDPGQALQVISRWQLPPDLLMTCYEALVITLTAKTAACDLVKVVKYGRMTDYSAVYGRTMDWNTMDWLKWLTERALTEFGVRIIKASCFDRAVRLMATHNCSETVSKVIEQVGDSFSITRVKEYARFFASGSNASATVLITLLEKFPWLLNTWIDHSGNTLLGLCVMHDYAHLRSLLDVPLVKKHINVESKDGLTPLMLAADYPGNVNEMVDLIRVGSADAHYVNRHHETVLHRIAASNNICARSCIEFFVHSPIVELRRKGDAATALMIALARDNVDVAELLISRAGAKATTWFGHSEYLRTVDAIFLRGRSLSLALLAEFGIEPDARVIAEYFRSRAVFTEECFVPMTGMEDNSRRSNEVYRGDLMERLEKQLFAVTGTHRMSWGLKGIGWTLLKDGQDFSNMEWKSVLQLLHNKGLEADVSTTIGYETNECAACDEESKDADGSASDMKRGKAKCGHYFHAGCWERLKGTNSCPFCKTSTTFTIERSSPFDPDPEVKLQSDPDEQRSYRVVDCGVTTVSSTSSKEQGLEKGIGEVDSYRNVARYEFLFHGVWMDESSPLNVLENNKPGTVVFYSSE